MSLTPRLETRLYDANLSTPTLLEDLTERVQGLRFSTALHGGFRQCDLFLEASLSEAWEWLHQGGRKGRHFSRLTVHEGQTLVWEGRVVAATLRASGQARGVGVTALGYWSACRDRYYAAGAGGATDWTAGGPHTADDIIKEMLTQQCPDIASDQSGIEANSRDLAGIDLSAPEYPQVNIVDRLGSLSDSDGSVWHFAVWNDRKPYWSARSAAAVDWYVWLRDTRDLTLQQDASQLRNAITPVVGGTAGTEQEDADSLAIYPRRELRIDLPDGANANTQADAASAAAAERSVPRQSQSFRVSGRLYLATGGQLAATPKWRVRAGDVVRVQDLVPDTAPTPELDGLRTFFVLGTEYDADSDVLTIQPDTFDRRLARLLPRLGSMERQR